MLANQGTAATPQFSSSPRHIQELQLPPPHGGHIHLFQTHTSNLRLKNAKKLLSAACRHRAAQLPLFPEKTGSKGGGAESVCSPTTAELGAEMTAQRVTCVAATVQVTRLSTSQVLCQLRPNWVFGDILQGPTGLPLQAASKEGIAEPKFKLNREQRHREGAGWESGPPSPPASGVCKPTNWWRIAAQPVSTSDSARQSHPGAHRAWPGGRHACQAP